MRVTSGDVNVVISGVLLACTAVLVLPPAARLMLDPADPTTKAWRLVLPLAAGVGMVSLLLPAGGIALGLALFYLLWVGYLTAGAAVQASRAGGPAAWAHAGSHLVLVGGVALFVLERAGWQPGRAGLLLAAAAAAHVTVALTGVAIAWDRLGETRSRLLPAQPAGAALLIGGWVTGAGWVAAAGALVLLGCAAVTGRSAWRAPSGGAPAAGRRRARTGAVLAPVGLLGPLAGSLPGGPVGLGVIQLGLAVTAFAVLVAALGWALLLAPVSTACATAERVQG